MHTTTDRQCLIITGTGTDIGKTIVTAGLLRAFMKKGRAVQAVKIVQTGTERSSGGLPGDAGLYASFVDDLTQSENRKRGLPPARVLHTYALAASPALAQAHERRQELTVRTLSSEIRELLRTSPADVLLFETAGGLHVPLNPREDMLDLLRDLGFPVLLCAQNTLGAINHTLLSLDSLGLSGLPVAGVILNDRDPCTDPAEAAIRDDNPAVVSSDVEKRFSCQTRNLPAPPVLRLPPFEDMFSLHTRDVCADLLSPCTEPLRPRQTSDGLVRRDRSVLWHPYTRAHDTSPLFPIVSAHHNRLVRPDGTELIDGMSSWWCAIHGYGNPELVRALQTQAAALSHVMFGGLTHEPAIRLGEALAARLPEGLSQIFLVDSGSVAVEVALKMALQYHIGRGDRARTRFLTPMGGYHGDTFGAMSVCDPVTGMHSLFNGTLVRQVFFERPRARFDAPYDPGTLSSARQMLEEHGEEIAALILEPVVQGAGGMWFYHPGFLKDLTALARSYGCLVIYDEIATGFGHTGRYFASEWAGTAPDILCLGKALTGGMLTMAATCATDAVARTISDHGHVFMHGPTFMGNPLAASVALASLRLLDEGDWQTSVRNIEQCMRTELAPCREFRAVRDVRVLGDIGVVETVTPVDTAFLADFFVRQGVWIRPFSNLVYIMPPYCSPPDDIRYLCRTICRAVEEISQTSHIS